MARAVCQREPAVWPTAAGGWNFENLRGSCFGWEGATATQAGSGNASASSGSASLTQAGSLSAVSDIASQRFSHVASRFF